MVCLCVCVFSFSFAVDEFFPLHHISLFLSDVYSNVFVVWVGILGVGFGLNCGILIDISDCSLI